MIEDIDGYMETVYEHLHNNESKITSKLLVNKVEKLPDAAEIAFPEPT